MKYCKCCCREFTDIYYAKHLLTIKHLKQNNIYTNKILPVDENTITDIDIVNKVKDDWTFIQSISPNRYNDNLINMLLSISGNYIKFIPKDKLTVNNVMIAVENDENSVRYLPFELINNYEIALKCVNKNGNLLKYFDDYKNDYNVCKTAINSRGLSWFYISDNLKNNEELLILAIEQNKNILLLLNQNKGYFDKYKNIINDKIDKYDYSLFKTKNGECIICMDTKNIVVLSCFETHCVCKNCFQHINDCPFCRRKINKIQVIKQTKIWS